MKLRPATRTDLPAMLALGPMIHAESRFAAFPYDPAKLSKSLEHLIALQDKGAHLCLLAENREGQLIGGFIGALEEYFFSSVKTANSILIWVAPDYRGSAAALRFISAFRDWAKNRGAVEVCILVAGGVAIGRTDRFLRKLGFHQTGGNYAASL